MRGIIERFALIIGTYPCQPKDEFQCTAIISLAGIKARPRLTKNKDDVVLLGNRLYEVARHWVDHMQKGHPMVLDSFLFTAQIFGLSVCAKIGKVMANGTDEQECIVKLTAGRHLVGNRIIGKTLQMTDLYCQDKNQNISLNEYIEADIRNRCKQYNIPLKLELH